MIKNIDLKGKLDYFTRFSVKKRVDRRLIYALGLFGLLVVGVTPWLAWKDWRASRADEFGEVEVQQAIAQLVEPIQSIKRVLNDQQVQDLALRAVENPDHADDLFAYVNGRINQITSVSVYDNQPMALNPADLGPSGFAVLDMILTTLANKQPLLQMHQSAEPPRLFDAMAIRSREEIVGVMVIAIDPDYVLGGFTPAYGTLGFMRLSQYNGRQRGNMLGEWGDAGLLGEVPDRRAVPGSLFRIEFPLQQHIGLIGSGLLLLAVLVGVVCLVASAVLFRSNRVWEREHRKERALKEHTAARVEAPSLPPVALAAGLPDRESTEPDTESDPEADPTPETTIPEPPPMRLHYDIAERRKLKEAEHTPVELTAGIFRAYDIRGVIDKTLDSGIARRIGQAIGTTALERDAGPVVVARDGRLSGPYLMDGMIDGITSAGCDVLDIGAVPTGVLYYAAFEMASGSGVMITGSHNPPDYNGFKVMIAGDTLHGEAITGLHDRIQAGDLRSGTGTVTRKNVVPNYIKRIADDIQVERDLKVVIDCGNGIGGVCAADVLRAIGVEVLPLFDEVDGTFPNHHPDPSEPENLEDLIESVRLMDADLGLALDGDADRLGVVTLAGDIIYPDRIMMLLALDVLDRNPGATVIYDVKCTGHLPRVIREAGGNPVMYKTGHSLIKSRMKEIGSPFAGEMSGHFFFEERWYGVDDGIYSAARLLEILGSTETPPEAILNALPSSYSTPELKVQMQEGENHEFIEAFKAAARFEGATISTIDGLRADFEDGWGLVRASNTTPILVVRFDAETEQALERIKENFRSAMLAVRPDLGLPF